MATNIRDPRTIITPDAFELSKALLGTPLGSPWRRLWALLIDLVVIGLLTAVTASISLILWGAVAIFLVTMAFRRPGRSFGQVTSVLFRGATGCLGTVILLGVLIGYLSLQDDNDFVDDFRAGLSDDESGAVAPDAGSDAGDDEASEAARAPAAAVAALSDDEVVARYVELRAVETEDEAGLTDDRSEMLTLVRRRLALQLAADTLDELADELGETRRSLADAEARLAAGDEGFRGLLRDIWDQAGSAIGLWSMYFTIALTLGNGRTVGKKLMGLRVLRLDGERLNWWSSFERAGGYVAGIATGTLGFLQVFWDPNRQCVHDKIVGTVVVIDGAEIEPGAWQEAWAVQQEAAGPQSPTRR